MNRMIDFVSSQGLPIHLTVPTAGLYAQVLPALVIALLLEGKVKVNDFPRYWLAVTAEMIRILAVVIGSVSSLTCLYLVGVNQEGQANQDWGATVALFLIGVAFVIFVIKVLTSGLQQLTKDYANQGTSGRANGTN